MRDRLRQLVPFGLRVELARWRHAPRRFLQRHAVARQRAPDDGGGWVLASGSSPLRRHLAAAEDLPCGHEQQNVGIVAGRIDRLLLLPHEIFSHHAAVGRPSIWRGFRRGLELRQEQPALGVGGGACKVSNLVYRLALLGGMRIVERHRHALDLFPDSDRTVPFGCGATVFYNYADLRFENPLPQAVTLRLAVCDGALQGELRCAYDPGFRVEIYEVDHRFVHFGGGWLRENRIRRRFRRPTGEVLLDQEVSHNRARVLYEPHLALPAEGACCAA